MTIKLDHVNMTVANLDESVAWYSRIFGFKKMEEGINQLGRKWATISVNDYALCMSERPDRLAADSDAVGDSIGHQLYHFGIRVSDEAEWRKTVAREQFQLYYGGEVHYPFSTSWYIHDPSGHELEVSCVQHTRSSDSLSSEVFLPLRFPNEEEV